MPLYDEDGFLIVKETNSCEHFEPVPGRLFCMKECWYCKWAGFHDMGSKDISEGSICRYSGNSLKAQERNVREDYGEMRFAYI